MNRHYIIPIFVPHEGCPHNCVFCNQEKIAGENENIDGNFVKTTVDEYMATMNRENAIIEISFFGGTFTAIPINKQRELLAVAKDYKAQGKIDYIRLSTRPDYIDDFILTHLKEYTVDIIELGVQSLDEEVLIKSGRGHRKEDVYKASELIKKYGFTLGHQIMLGLPGDNFEKDINTTKEVIKMKPSICRIYPALVIKDTPMEILYNKGLYNPYSLDEALEISKEVYGLLTLNNINVIRVGLQATDNINVNGDIVAGPFHPAFKELMEGALLKDMILKNLNPLSKDIEIKIHPKTISKLYTNKKKYFNDILKQINTNKLKVTQDENIEVKSIHIIQDGDCNKMSIRGYLHNIH